jgi:pimeloyl-ACP methyl ester carboxylesterase
VVRERSAEPVGDAAGTSAPAQGAAVPDSRVMVLPDGRHLGWLEVGVPHGLPVVALHGTPGSRLHLVPSAPAARAAGVRLIAPDRPGYGLSTLQRGRSITGWADDVTSLTDHLGIDRFAVVGISGGGPFALACGRRLPDRVTSVGVVSGVAPLQEPGSEDGMLPSDRVLLRLARRSPTLVRPICWAVTSWARRRPERALEMMADELAPSDVAVLRRPDVHDAFLADLVAPVATTAAATAQEYGLLTRSWGFALREVEVPVDVWHGDADREVPLAQAREQVAALPHAVLHQCVGEGHLLVADRLEEVLGVVTGQRER